MSSFTYQPSLPKAPLNTHLTPLEQLNSLSSIFSTIPYVLHSLQGAIARKEKTDRPLFDLPLRSIKAVLPGTPEPSAPSQEILDWAATIGIDTSPWLPPVIPSPENRHVTGDLVPLDAHGYSLLGLRSASSPLEMKERWVLSQAEHALAKRGIYFEKMELDAEKAMEALSLRQPRGMVQLRWGFLTCQSKILLAFLYDRTVEGWPGTLAQYAKGVLKNWQFEDCCAWEEMSLQEDASGWDRNYQVNSSTWRLFLERKALHERDNVAWARGWSQEDLEMQLALYKAWEKEWADIRALAIRKRMEEYAMSQKEFEVAMRTPVDTPDLSEGPSAASLSLVSEEPIASEISRLLSPEESVDGRRVMTLEQARLFYTALMPIAAQEERAMGIPDFD